METLTMIIYALLIVLIAVAIIIGIRIIITLHKVDDLLDDVSEKVHTLDRVFEIVDAFNNKMSVLGDTVIGFVSGGIKRIFKERKKFEDKEDVDDE